MSLPEYVRLTDQTHRCQEISYAPCLQGGENINKVLLEGVTIDNSNGILSALSDAILFGDAVKAHQQVEGLDVHKVFIVGSQILVSDSMMFLTFVRVFDLLNIFRSIACGYSTQLCRDVTSKASTAALNKLRFCVNMLGSSFAPLSHTVMQNVCRLNVNLQMLTVKPIVPRRQQHDVSFRSQGGVYHVQVHHRTTRPGDSGVLLEESAIQGQERIAHLLYSR